MAQQKGPWHLANKGSGGKKDVDKAGKEAGAAVWEAETPLACSLAH